MLVPLVTNSSIIIKSILLKIHCEDMSKLVSFFLYFFFDTELFFSLSGMNIIELIIVWEVTYLLERDEGN